MSRLRPPVAEWMNSTASSEEQSSAGILISMPDSVLKLRLSSLRMRAGLTVMRSSSRTPVSARASSNFGAARGKFSRMRLRTSSTAIWLSTAWLRTSSSTAVSVPPSKGGTSSRSSVSG